MMHDRVCMWAASPVGIVVVRGDCDLETCRLYIDRLQEVRIMCVDNVSLFTKADLHPVLINISAAPPQRHVKSLFLLARLTKTYSSYPSGFAH